MHFSEAFVAAVAILAFIFYAAFQQFLRAQRRQMIHRERLAALEKGIDLPPLEREIQRRSWNVQRILVLAGLTWVSLGTQYENIQGGQDAFRGPHSGEWNLR